MRNAVSSGDEDKSSGESEEASSEEKPTSSEEDSGEDSGEEEGSAKSKESDAGEGRSALTGQALQATNRMRHALDMRSAAQERDLILLNSRRVDRAKPFPNPPPQHKGFIFG